MDAATTQNKPWVLANSGLADFPQSVQDLILRKFMVILQPDFLKDPESFRNKIQGLLSTGVPPLDLRKEFLEGFPNLKVLASFGVGTNHLNVPLLRSLGLKVGHTPDVLSDAVADFTMGLVIATARRFKEATMAMHNWGDFHPVQKHNCKVMGTQVSESTLGIVGMGRIGVEIARRAMGFKMRVLYYNCTQRSRAVEEEVRATYCSSLKDLLPQVDFLVVMVPLTDETTHLIGREEFQLMKPSSFVINTSRGKVLDQEALIEALRSKVIAGAGLDVTDPEPLPADSPLLGMPNVFLTPHVASGTLQTYLAMMSLSAENLAAGIEGRPLPAEVPH